ncbi:two-component system sensor histidine kinase NtrB [Croceibacterium aestuarii]|uniref:two-component system sensor histidine kinase NtrB n=1 Tax=Croceibacterium aestuarii TaxID=3064139 RepID=UPI00272E5516|nr:ATP-binding protein [Croceibacterium sp. D39]
MNDPLDGAPGADAQVAGLIFGWLLLDENLVIQSANPAAEDLLGASARRMIGQPLGAIIDFGPEGMLERLAEPDAQLTARGVDIQVGDRELRVNLTLSEIASHPGWGVLTLSDTGHGERMADDERPAPLRGPAILAHEIKNPLAAIRGAAQLLAKKVGPGDVAMTALITDEVDRIAQLIDRMQKLGREQPEPVAPLNLHSAIHRACDTVFAANCGDVTLREEFDPSLPPVLANEGALVQVLVNLIANARDACSGEAQPEVAIRTRFVSGMVLNVIRLGRPVKLPIEIQVSDNGPGVDPGLADYIFEPFVSSKANGQGLGLALVRKLVRDMDGRITHERDEGAGLTHFRIHLPMAR